MIKIENLKKEYKNFSLDCTMEVQKGRITALVGQNGAGKSTAFKAILGLTDFDSGSVSVFGKNVRDLDARDRQRIGVVLSDSGFSGYLTIKDIIPVLSSLYEGFDLEFFKEQTRLLGLPADKKIKEFSTGMKAKLKVLVALSHGAELLILDEPTSGLDVVARDEILDLLRTYMEQNENRTVLISSHISSDLETLCDDIYMIHGGRIILHEDTDVLLDSYGIIKATDDEFSKLDKTYITYVKNEKYGVCALTSQRGFYSENYKDLAVEKGSIDGVIAMMIQGVKL